MTSLLTLSTCEEEKSGTNRSAMVIIETSRSRKSRIGSLRAGILRDDIKASRLFRRIIAVCLYLVDTERRGKCYFLGKVESRTRYIMCTPIHVRVHVCIHKCI